MNNAVAVQKVDSTQHLADDVGCLRLLNELFVLQQLAQVASFCSREWDGQLFFWEGEGVNLCPEGLFWEPDLCLLRCLQLQDKIELAVTLVPVNDKRRESKQKR